MVTSLGCVLMGYCALLDTLSRVRSLLPIFTPLRQSFGCSKASQAQGTLDAIKIKAIDSFELAYNIACSLSEEDKLKDAEQLLLTGRNIDQETPTKESLVDNVIENELHPFVIQLTYVHQLLGQTHEGTGAYTYIINQNLTVEPSQMDPTRKFVSVLLEMFPDNVMPILFQATALVIENRARKTEEILGQFTETLTENVAKLHFVEA
ncbi:hypothetical protein V6N13_142504 [Hibiscus sabdariffa]